jgi:hypothetical protein
MSLPPAVQIVFEATRCATSLFSSLLALKFVQAQILTVPERYELATPAT